MNKFRLAILIILIGSVSFIYGLPNIIIPFFLKDKQYIPLPIADHVIDETYIYAPKTREILMGNLFSYDALSFKTRKFPSPFVGETLPANLMAVLAKISGSLANGFIIADFLFPAITFYIFFLLIKELTNNYYLSILGGLVTIIIYDFIAVIPYPLQMINYFSSSTKDLNFLYFSRSFHPQISVFILILAEYFSIIALKTNKKKDIILSGICSGLLFYTYFFCWTFFYFGITLFLIWLIRRKKKQDIKTILMIMLIGIFIGSFYLINIIIFKFSFSSSDFFEKLSSSQLFFYPTTFRYLLLGLVLFLFKKRLGNGIFFLTFLVIGGSLLPHIFQIVIGRDLEGYHWVRRALIPTADVLMFVLTSRIINLINIEQTKFLLLKKYIKVLVILLVIFYGFSHQYFSSKRLAYMHKISFSQIELFNYINSLPKQMIIGAVSLSEQFVLPIYTSSLPFVPKASITLLSSDEVLNRWLIMCRIFNLSNEEVRKFLSYPINNFSKQVNEYDKGVPGYIFYFKADGKNKHELSESTINNILERYKKIIPEDIKTTKIDYIMAGPLEREIKNIDLDNFNFFRIVFQNDDYTLYQII